MVVILFSWISNFFKLSIVCRALVGTRFNSLPPMFKRLSFLRTKRKTTRYLVTGHWVSEVWFLTFPCRQTRWPRCWSADSRTELVSPMCSSPRMRSRVWRRFCYGSSWISTTCPNSSTPAWARSSTSSAISPIEWVLFLHGGIKKNTCIQIKIRLIKQVYLRSLTM